MLLWETDVTSVAHNRRDSLMLYLETPDVKAKTVVLLRHDIGILCENARAPSLKSRVCEGL